MLSIVIALDISPVRLALARHNAEIYGVADRIEFILADYLSFTQSYLSMPQGRGRKIDVVFLSPPWGGPEYLSGTGPTTSALSGNKNGPASSHEHPSYSLASIKPIHGAELFHLTSRITPNIAYFLPRNTQLEEISALRKEDPEEMIEIEEEWMGSKLKALTIYTGGLVEGQGHLF
jgi:trimethylguanosine synthase